MPAIKRVIDYSGLDYNSVLNLPCDTFLLMNKNSVMAELESTEEGRQYLADCKRLQQEEPDEEAIFKEINRMQRGVR